VIEAFRVRDAQRFALAVQWHPEWKVLSNSFSRALFAAFGRSCSERARSK
jgi:putative glutamine amidotransferase